MQRQPWMILLILAAGPLAADEPAAPSRSPQTMERLRAACQDDVKTLCPSVQPGGGRIIACLKEHKESVSTGCKQAVASARQQASQ